MRCKLEKKLRELIQVANCGKSLHLPVAQLLRLGMDGEGLSGCMDDLLAACDASAAVSVAEGELCFGLDSGP